MVNIFRQTQENAYNSIPHCYGLMSTKELEEIGLQRLLRYPQLSLKGQGSLVAVIDTGINLLSPFFIYEDGSSKVESLWDQTDETGPAPEGFSFGRDWEKEEIGDKLKSSDELPADEEGHGTFLAAIAAAREDPVSGFSGAAPDSGLIIVKLRQAAREIRDYYSVPEAVWACQENDVISALKYTVHKARQLGRPVSICLGIGTNMGGHDGTSDLERYISEISLMTGVSVHVAGGNEEISAHHFRGLIEDGKSYTSINFNVAEGENGFIMELWGSPPYIFTISLTSPGGENVDRLQLKQGELRRIEFFPEETVLEVQSFLGESVSGDQVIRMRFTNPAPGVWQLRVYPDGDAGAQAFHLWMPVTDFVKSETFFLNASVDETITSPGNADYNITYTPYDINNNSLYLRASRGFTRDGRIKPDLAAPGVSISVPSDIPGGRPRVRSGSSIAAAYGAGLGALAGEWAIVKGNDPYYNGQKLRYYLIQGAVRTGAYVYPNREWGYGIVNIYNAFLSLRR